jgi:hypothetical protein
MPIGVTLDELRRELRAEIGHSLSPSQGVNFQDTLDAALRRAQTELWTEHQWPSLEFKVIGSVTAGSRYSDLPAKLRFTPLLSVWTADGTANYRELDYGIQPSDLNVFDSEAGQQSWPIRKYQHAPKFDSGTGLLQADDGQIEWWPIPSQPTNLLYVSQALLPPLITDSDRCALDSYAITMFAGAQILARQKNEDAATLLGRAQEYLRRIRTQQGAKKRRIRVLGNADTAAPAARPYLDYIPMT